MSEKSDMAAFLARHPKLSGVLFTALLLLTQAGSAVAGNAGCGCTGP
jgi:hypothetical protein